MDERWGWGEALGRIRPAEGCVALLRLPAPHGESHVMPAEAE
jgi:hypothetical protein